MKMSDIIADFIGEMLSEGGGVAEVQRKSLADRFSCVPSQINYVIETRFTPEHGYLVESQRGGGGYIRIVRLLDDKQRTLLEAARGIGGRLTQNDAAPKKSKSGKKAGVFGAYGMGKCGTKPEENGSCCHCPLPCGCSFKSDRYVCKRI